MSIQEKEDPKPFELEGPSKEEVKEASQPLMKEELSKDWQFKKDH